MSENESMRMIEKKSKEDTRPYYWAAEIPSLLGPATPSLSSFYRYVQSGKIRKVESEDQFNPAYHGEDVRRFLKGEMSGKKGGKRDIRPPKRRYVKPSIGRPTIDYARGIPDLVFISSMELKVENAYSPQAQLSWITTRLPWIEKNEYTYWFLSSSQARDDVWASLAVLPMRHETLSRLLKGDMALEKLTPDDLLTPDQSPFSCYLLAIARSDHGDTLVQLLQHVFAFWCEKTPALRIEKLFVLVPTGITPLQKLVKEFYFSPIRDGNKPPANQTVWELDFGFYNPSEEVQKVQNCFQKDVFHSQERQQPQTENESMHMTENRSHP